MGRGSGLCLPTMLARPFYRVGILDNERKWFSGEIKLKFVCLVHFNSLLDTTFFEVDTIFEYSNLIGIQL